MAAVASWLSTAADVPDLDRVERLPEASHWVHHDEHERVQKATGPKEFDWIHGASHVDLCDREPYVGPAVEKLARFFGDNLGQAA
jgi:hypothetical protein